MDDLFKTLADLRLMLDDSCDVELRVDKTGQITMIFTWVNSFNVDRRFKMEFVSDDSMSVEMITDWINGLVRE